MGSWLTAPNFPIISDTTAVTFFAKLNILDPQSSSTHSVAEAFPSSYHLHELQPTSEMSSSVEEPKRACSLIPNSEGLRDCPKQQPALCLERAATEVALPIIPSLHIISFMEIN